MEADSKRKVGQNRIFVTFDQPLYYKAREILECCESLSNVTVRLGGFHTMMSFMGAMGFIMDGSGLKESFCEVYAENSVDKILSGHAYARAVRGYLLHHLALSQIILSSFSMDEAEKEMIEEFLDLGEDILNELDSEDFQKLYNKKNLYIYCKKTSSVSLFIA